MGSNLPDVQSERPSIGLEIDRVGILNVCLPVGRMFSRREEYMLQSPVFSVFVNLPASLRAIHASRSYETLYEVVSDAAWSEGKLENVSKKIVETLLEKHEYATKAEARFSGQLFRKVKAPMSGKSSFERLLVRAGAVGWRVDGGVIVKRSIGITVYGTTACPCAQKVIKSMMEGSRELSDGSLIATHMQRALASVDLKLVDGESVDLLEVADVVKACLSSPLYGLLKRVDEAHLVMEAVRNPVFVEDAARIIAIRVARSFPELSPETAMRVVVKSIESIHNHDFMAEFKSRISNIRHMYG